MKKILITWYGITDLKASMGVEYSKGPILSALKADDYTDVLILGYTNSEKVAVTQEQFDLDIGSAQDDFKSNRQSEMWNVVNRYTNTEVAHRHFINWLKEGLEKEGMATDINFHSVALAHLNDTEGIYEAAVQALKLVNSLNVNKEVTFYLSPGTPVMAFVWAFVALQEPSLKKRLIASSKIGKQPEEVSLPNEWLEWHARQIPKSGKHITEFDVVFHLFGEQRMPSLLGIKQFKSKKHIFVNSKRYPAGIMKQFLDGSEFGEVSVDPFDPEDVKEKISNIISTLPSNINIGFNLTGGTKLMYAGAFAICKKVNGTPFYFNGGNNQMIFLNDFDTKPVKLIGSVETFINLNSDDLFISNEGYWKDIPNIDSEERKKLTLLLWKNRSKISKLYREILRLEDRDGVFKVEKGSVYVEFTYTNKAIIELDGKKFIFENWPKFVTYIAGGWLEEYTYMQLKPYLDRGIIKDLRIGLEISFKENTTDNVSGFSDNLKNIFGETYQELDVVFTDGKQLYVVECKAGSIKSEYVMKLQNIIRYFGGIESRGILAAAFAPHSKVVQKKIDNARNLSLISGQAFESSFNELFSDNNNRKKPLEEKRTVITKSGIRKKV